MNILNPQKLKRLVPVKLIGNKLVKIKDLSLDQKDINKPKYNTKTTKTLETSYFTNSYKSTTSNVHNIKLIRNLSQKYERLMNDLKNGKEIVGTVEEKKDKYPTTNPFNHKINLNHHNFISKTKSVLFKKQDQNAYMLKIIDKDLYMTIYNKTQPPKKVYNKSDIKKIIKIQKRFKGFAVREVEQKVRNLKVKYCLVETFCLLTMRAFDNAKKRLMYKMIKAVFYDPFNINDEVYLKDKLEFKLPDKYYNMTSLQEIDFGGKKKKMLYNNKTYFNRKKFMLKNKK
jgi:hypothetical protein